jgi:hypothetical protein
MKMKTSAAASLAGALVAIAALSAAAGPQTFTGIVSDDICVKGDHSHMRMGPTDAECVVACVSGHDAAYVLYDGKNFYKLSGRQALEKFAGHKVKVTGELDEKTQIIRMDSITSAN